MICPRCRTKMVEAKRSFHKKRKWICPKCKKVRMQEQSTRPPKGRVDSKQ